jgi:PDZ domain-containing protein
MDPVWVTSPDRRISLAEAMEAWFDPTRAVYPRDVIYPPQQSVQQVQQQSSVEMTNSQDTAVAAALEELGYHFSKVTEVLAVTPGAPADGKLQVHDQLLSVNGARITGPKSVADAVQKVGVGGTATFVVRRDGATRTVKVQTQASDSNPHHAVVGVVVGVGYNFPFRVSVDISNNIGGPSAGLMFSLAIYDTLTRGSLTGGAVVAGTGTISANGSVGPIGGIQQKIVAAADAGAKLFFVPPGNCAEALSADVSSNEIELVKATTMSSAVHSLKAYAHDRHATLPQCSTTGTASR